MANREVKIFCPRCAWEPKQSSRWMCLCLHCWNTFDTGGVCPSCGKVWTETQCLACQRWSPHADWYHEFVSEEVGTRTERLAEEASEGQIVFNNNRSRVG